MPLLGSHLSIAGGYYKAVETAAELRMDCVPDLHQEQQSMESQAAVRRRRQPLSGNGRANRDSHALRARQLSHQPGQPGRVALEQVARSVRDRAGTGRGFGPRRRGDASGKLRRRLRGGRDRPRRHGARQGASRGRRRSPSRFGSRRPPGRAPRWATGSSTCGPSWTAWGRALAWAFASIAAICLRRGIR